MNHRIAQKLWKGCNNCIHITIGRTEWTSGNGYWMAHASIVGREPNHKQVAETDSRKINRAFVKRLTGDARKVQSVSDRRLVAETWEGWTEPLIKYDCGPSSAVFVNADFHDALDAICPADLRADPWTSALSWWSPSGYPVAILMGVRVAHGSEVKSA